MPFPTISEENSLTGTDTWRISNGRLPAIEGFASKASVLRGESITLFVTTDAPAFRIEIFRMGWYQGLGARLMRTFEEVAGVAQPGPATDDLGMVSCDWAPSYVLDVPADWCPGVYLAKLRTIGYPDPAAREAGFERYIIFVVLDDTRRPMLFQTSVTTYQAYNVWGGKSLYGDACGNFDLRSRAVSFDRPYAHPDGYGSGHFLTWEYPLVRWLEREGYDLSYATNVDVHRDPDLVSDYALFLSVGHDEYWSFEMREHVENALRGGTSLAFLGANAMYWQVRLEPSPIGPDRRMICYKDDPNNPIDPIAATDPRRTTTLWRNLGRPEQAIIGVMYDGWFRTDQDLNVFPIVPINTQLWPYADSGLSNGEALPGLVGYEYDMTFDNFERPEGLVRLAESPVTDDSGRNSVSHATMYTAPGGAMVFGCGTNNWAFGLVDEPGRPPAAHPGIQALTRNILDGFMTMPHQGRVLVAEFVDEPPAAVRYWEARRAYAELDGWHDAEDLVLTGAFFERDRDHVMFINRDPGMTGGRVLIADLSLGPPARTSYWEDWGQSALLDGWHDAGDLVLVGDFRGRSHDQVMFINRDTEQGGRVLIADFSSGEAAELYREDWGQSELLDGWHDPEDLVLVGDFMARGYDQVLFINRDPEQAGRVLIADFSQGPLATELYREDWGQSDLLDGWHDAEDLVLAGDFMNRNRDQVMFIDRDPAQAGSRVLIVDFSEQAPTEVYREDWNIDGLLGWHDQGDLAAAGDFAGRGYDQALFINRSELGGRVLVADFSQGPPVAARYRENWGDADLLNGWHDVGDLFLAGRLMASERAQALFINRPEVPPLS